MEAKALELHKKWMDHCILLGKEALAKGNPPVGALVVYRAKIIGIAIETAKTTGNITHHAELLAIQDAIDKGYKPFLKEAILYSTHEPCIMCSYAIRTYKIPQLVYGVSAAHIGGDTSTLAVLHTTDVPHWKNPPEIVKGIYKERCEALNTAFESKQLNAL